MHWSYIWSLLSLNSLLPREVVKPVILNTSYFSRTVISLCILSVLLNKKSRSSQKTQATRLHICTRSRLKRNSNFQPTKKTNSGPVNKLWSSSTEHCILLIILAASRVFTRPKDSLPLSNSSEFQLRHIKTSISTVNALDFEHAELSSKNETKIRTLWRVLW